MHAFIALLSLYSIIKFSLSYDYALSSYPHCSSNQCQPLFHPYRRCLEGQYVWKGTYGRE